MTATAAGGIIHDEVFLVLTDANHDKGYHSQVVEVMGKFYHCTAHGRRTSSKHENTNVKCSLSAAYEAHQKIVAEKRGKGYKVCDPQTLLRSAHTLPEVFRHLELDKTVGVFAPSYQATPIEIGSGQRHYDFDEE